jgi:hypothetical protein
LRNQGGGLLLPSQDLLLAAIFKGVVKGGQTKPFSDGVAMNADRTGGGGEGGPVGHQ